MNEENTQFEIQLKI